MMYLAMLRGGAPAHVKRSIISDVVEVLVAGSLHALRYTVELSWVKACKELLTTEAAIGINSQGTSNVGLALTVEHHILEVER